MSLIGYNYDPESGDASVGVETEQDGKSAMLYIDEETIGLTYAEVCELALQLRRIKHEIEWNTGKLVMASTTFTQRSHIIYPEDKDAARKQDAGLTCMREMDDEVQPRTLCGQKPPDHFRWDFSPADQPSHKCCKKCLSAYNRMYVQDERVGVVARQDERSTVESGNN